MPGFSGIFTRSRTRGAGPLRVAHIGYGRTRGPELDSVVGLVHFAAGDMQELLRDWCMSLRITPEPARQAIGYTIHHVFTAALMRQGRTDMHRGVEF